MRRGAAAALSLALLPSPAGAWGGAGHRLVNRKAVATLPLPLRTLFEANADYLGEHAIDPDLWRRFGEGGPDHYLHLDAFAAPDGAGIARDEAAQLLAHGPASSAEGRLPWKVAELYAELVAAFRAGVPERVLERAAVLGHYVGDAHVPLHAVRDYDGLAAGQAGVHGRWEAALVARFERQLEPRLRPAPAVRVADPWAAALEVLRQSAADVPAVMAADRELRGAADFAATPQDDRYDDAYYSRLLEREQGRVLARLAGSVQLLGSLWFSAWEEAGRPALPQFRFPYVRRGARAVMVSLDGAGAALVEDAVGRGLMPRLAALRARGTRAASAGPLPTKTAPSHAALYTGAWAGRNGITGNEVPVPARGPFAFVGGYRSDALAAEPLWVTAAREGLKATVVGATQVFPFAPYLEGRRFGADLGSDLTFVDGYGGPSVSDAVYRAADVPLAAPAGWSDAPAGEAREFRIAVGDAAVYGLLYDDPGDPAAGFDTLRLAPARDARGVDLKPLAPAADASTFQGLRLSVGGSPAGVFFRLFELSADGRRLLLYRSKAHTLSTHPGSILGAALEATGGFVGNGADGTYRSGGFGPTLARGGDGTAEARYLETVALCLRQMERLACFGWERTPWDVLFAYVPIPDEPLHAFMGHLDPALPGHDPALATRLRPVLDDTLRAVDRYVGALADRADARTVVALVADHGHVGVSAVVRPNVALARAGLAAADASGRIDTGRSRAAFPLNEGGYVLINDGGEALRGQVAEILRGVTDPRTGGRAIREVLDVRSASRPGLSPAGGQLFLLAAPGYTLSEDFGDGEVEAIDPKGTHFQDPERPEMLASVTLAGAGVRQGVDLGTIRHVDVAPTLAALLGIEAPRQAEGRVLEAALARHATARPGPKARSGRPRGTHAGSVPGS